MDNPWPEQAAVVEEVRELLSSTNGVILTDYRRLAVRDLGLVELEALLERPTAMAFVRDDVVPVAKALRDYARTNPNLVVKGGVLGTRALTAADAGAIAELPARDVLLARIAGGL